MIAVFVVVVVVLVVAVSIVVVLRVHVTLFQIFILIKQCCVVSAKMEPPFTLLTLKNRTHLRTERADRVTSVSCTSWAWMMKSRWLLMTKLNGVRC